MTTLQEKWAPVLNSDEASKIGDSHKRAVVAQVLENQEKALIEERAATSFGGVNETTTLAAGVDNFDPVLISLVRRAMPNLMAFDVAGVQPMSGPTGLIFAMKSHYTNQAGTEALGLAEPDTDFSGAGAHPAGIGMSTAAGEAITPAEMAFSIDKTSVTAKTRALAASYSMELAQDLKAVHGLSAESELANILSTEILAEMNREMVHTINVAAQPGTIGTLATTVRTIDATATTGDLDGRWNVERFKALHHIIEREANGIAISTRRGKGNFLICSADVASSLAAAGTLDYTPALQAGLNVDAAGNTFAGVIGGKMKVYVDPYAAADYITVGYKGSNAYDAGIFYCPYVPLTMMRASDAATFQPKIGFKSRYGMVANPFTSLTANSNVYYRTSLVTNL
tara:strand:+ start:264 stop:1454 length:1191 start_codon:yes stop_codon:yes gene_type:complete